MKSFAEFISNYKTTKAKNKKEKEAEKFLKSRGWTKFLSSWYLYGSKFGT